jgi:hypothetical protein
VTLFRILSIAVLLLGVGGVGIWFYFERVANPRVSRELVEQPDGERAAKVMLVTLPSGRRIPVNYLREGAMVYAAADGSWWKELAGGPFPVTLLVRGETLAGDARAVRDDRDYTEHVFAKLRPNAIKGFGTLVEIRLHEPAHP